MQSYLSPAELALCAQALEAACAELSHPSDSVRTEMAARMAARIMARAVWGERDLDKLKTSATAWIKAA
jgi:hypothetical protein